MIGDLQDFMDVAQAADDAALSALSLKTFHAQADPVTGLITPLPTQQSAMCPPESLFPIPGCGGGGIPSWVPIGIGALLILAMLKK